MYGETSAALAQGPNLLSLIGDRVRLSAESLGDPDGPLVILLHGGGQSRSAWRGTARSLAGHGFHAVSLDLRGHGDSEWDSDGDYRFDRHVADMIAVISHYDEPAILIGASLGGHISLLTAAAHPNLIRAIVLADVTPFLDETVADGLRAALRSGIDGFATLEDAAAMIARTAGQPARAPSDKLREHLRVGADGRFYWCWDPRAVEDRFVRHAGEGGMFAQAAERLSVPTLVLRAGDSTLTTPEQVSRFRAVSPHIQVEEIPGIGHMLTGDSNRAYTPGILAFLATLPPRPAKFNQPIV